MKNIFINTLVFCNKEKPPFNQKKIIKELVEAGFKHIEIRREFFQGNKDELQEIGDLVKELDVTLYYSIPDTLFDDYKINITKLNLFKEEARILNAQTIKLAVGVFKNISLEDEVYLRSFTSNNIRLFVENDQSIENGTVNKILEFLQEAKSKSIKVKATFDIGNWSYTGEDVIENAKLLKEYVDYVHFKDIKIESGKMVATTLGEGVIDYKYIKNLFKNVDFGLEYPCGENVISVLKNEVEKLK